MPKKQDRSSSGSGAGSGAAIKEKDKLARRPLTPPDNQTMPQQTPVPPATEAAVIGPTANGASPNGAVPEVSTDGTRVGSGTVLGLPPQQRADLDMDHFRTLLLTERARLEAELEHIRTRNGDMDGALPEEGEGGEEDTADMATAMMDKEMDLSVEDEVEDLLAAVDHAMQKMEDGTYGVCDMSGEPIPASRLEFIPYASLTVECQAMAEGE